MSYIVTANTKYLHTQACLIKYIGYNSSWTVHPIYSGFIKNWILCGGKIVGLLK